MTILSTVAQGVETAFNAAGDLVSLGTVIQGDTGTYDPVTDVITGQTNIGFVRMIKMSVTTQDLEVSPIHVSDTKFLIPSSDIAPYQLTVRDQILFRGEVFNISRAKYIPGDSMVIAYCRKA